jgi:hypothetical protein
VCDPEVVARADAFAALAPDGFFSGRVPKKTNGYIFKIGAWTRKDESRRATADAIIAAVRKYPHIKYAFDTDDFADWPELDAALRLGGYEAMLDVVATMIPEPKEVAHG